MDACRETAIATYNMVPELTLLHEVVERNCFHCFHDREILVSKLATLDGHFQTYTRFIEAGCPPSYAEWPDTTVTKEEALDYWGEVRQYCHVIEGAIAFVDSPAGKREAHYENLRQELRYMEKTLDDIGGTTSQGNLSGLLAAIRETEKEMEAMDAESQNGVWVYEDGLSGKEYMNYEVGAAWTEIMKSAGRESVLVLQKY
jgi:hypothetical protein